MTKRLLMPDSLDALRTKVQSEKLSPWWEHFKMLARREPEFFSPYTVLAALVTDETVDRQLARSAFLHFVNVQKEGYISQDAQAHTHVISAPLARWAIYYDWVAGTGILSPDEEKSFRDYLLDYALVFPWTQASTRARQFDNQLMSNAFASAVVGYVLGIRHDNRPAARRLFRTGMDVLNHLLSIIPPGGYSPEGSTYHENVVTPLVLLASLFVEETAGQPTPKLQLLLETSCRMIGPDGLLPPWDHYGFCPASIKSSLAYLARITRDSNPLAIIRDQGMWYRTALPAWEIDDRLWTLVFWPADIDRGSNYAAYPSWMEPDVGGALQSDNRRLRLFQYWDECGGVPNAGRSQVDPNAISLDVDGSPILLDGHGAPTPNPVAIPEKEAVEYIGKRIIESVQEYAYSSWNWKMPTEAALKSSLSGNVGHSNALTFDGEFWYVPKAPRRGVGETIKRVGAMQIVRSEAARYYTDRYDVTSVARSSMLIHGLAADYIIVTDRVLAKTPHTITWQVYARQEAKIVGGQVVGTTPEQIAYQIVPLQEGTLELTPITGYPKIGDDRSALVRHTVARAADVRIDVMIAPQSASKEALDLNENWTRECDGKLVNLSTAYLTDSAAPATRVFKRTFIFAPESDSQYFIRVAISGQELRVVLNGKTIAQNIKQEKGHWPGSAMNLSHFYDVTDALVAGENKIELHAPFFHGESVLGPVTLFASCEAVMPASAKKIVDGVFKVSTAGTEHFVVSDNRAGVIAFEGRESDARYAVFREWGFDAVDARRVVVPGMASLHSDAPCDVSWGESETELSQFVPGSTIQIEWPGAELRVQSGGCLDITYLGSTPHRLCIDFPRPKAVFINGVSLGVLPVPTKGENGLKTLVLTASLVQAAGTLPKNVDDVFALVHKPIEQAAQACVEILRGNDWRLQMAAADVAGVLKLEPAVPALLEAFVAGESELPYPALNTWWRSSKMLRNPGSVEGDDPSVPLPLGVKRWRVRCACAMALGKIGDPRAVAPLERAMERCTDFFPVTSQLAVALGRLGSPSSVAVLERHSNHAEINTQLHARLSIKLLTGKISRDEFERIAGLA